MVTHALAQIRAVLHAAPQLLLGGEEEFAQQTLFPAVPQRFVGGADVRHGQADQVAQPVLVLHHLGELLDDGGILNIAALRRHRHQQMMAHQPGDQLRLARVEAVQLGEFQRVLRAEDRVIAVAAFGDVVQQRRHQQQLLLRQTRPEFDA